MKNHNWRGYGEISGAYWTCVKGNAKKRKLKILVSIADAWNVFLSQERKCALSGVNLSFSQNWSKNGQREQSASLDRKDNSKSYTKENIRWIHKQLNQMRIRINDEDFLKWCKLVAEANSATETNMPILEANRLPNP